MYVACSYLIELEHYLIKVMKGVDIAYYLIHSMEGSSKEWKKFAERDRVGDVSGKVQTETYGNYY
jgi:tetrahydromethanopterin S-methyltransferase subunit B